MGLAAGRLRHRLVIKDPNKTSQTTKGTPTGTPSTLATVWAEIAALTGAERFEAQQVTARVTHRITVRHRTDVTAKHYGEWSGHTFDFEAVFDPTGLGEELTILAEELNP